MNIAVIGKRAAGKSTARNWLLGHGHFVIEVPSDESEEFLYDLKGRDEGFVIFKVFAERWRRQNRAGRVQTAGFDDGWVLDGTYLVNQTIGNYGSLDDLYEQLHHALQREEARV